jgi:outer membrane protein TolC
MKRCLFILAVGLLGLSSKASPGDTLKIDDCLKTAAERSPLNRQRNNSEAIFNNKLRNLNTNWYPEVGINAQAIVNSETIDFSDVLQNMPSVPSIPLDQYKLWADIQQQLYDGGMNRALKEIERASLETNLMQTEAELLGIQLQINQVYFNMLQTRNNHEILTLTLGELIELKEMVRAGVEHGILLKDNLLSMEAEEISLRQKITETELQNARLLKVMEILMDTTFSSAVVFIEPGEPRLNESGMRPELLIFDLQKKTLDAGKKLVSSSEMPKLFAFMQLAYGRPGYNMMSDDFHTFYSIGAGLKWNFLHYGENRRQKIIIEYQQDNVEVKRENFNNQLELQLQAELTNQARYDSMIVRDERILEIRKEIAESSLSKLKNGTITSADYLRDMNAEILAKLQLQSHKILKKQAVYSYLLLQGKF